MEELGFSWVRWLPSYPGGRLWHFNWGTMHWRAGAGFGSQSALAGGWLWHLNWGTMQVMAELGLLCEMVLGETWGWSWHLNWGSMHLRELGFVM